MKLAPTEKRILAAIEKVEDGEGRPATTQEIRVACRPAETTVSIAELEAAGLIDDVGPGYRLSVLGSSTLFDAIHR